MPACSRSRPPILSCERKRTSEVHRDRREVHRDRREVHRVPRPTPSSRGHCLEFQQESHNPIIGGEGPDFTDIYFFQILKYVHTCDTHPSIYAGGGYYYKAGPMAMQAVRPMAAAEEEEEEGEADEAGTGCPELQFGCQYAVCHSSLIHPYDWHALLITMPLCSFHALAAVGEEKEAAASPSRFGCPGLGVTAHVP
eukprot:SAG22_NODE_231_length_14551_cov_22.298090_12_plen_196_part_00